ncbi:MAG TPA: hypothetical protein PLF01_07555, partial [Alphaproteobacteria bacterium]|nr:hypothetical protein [Alphaproteobacteria bacterium]
MNRLVLLLLLVLFPSAAKADYFLWQDPESGLTMTFPDTWKEQNNRAPDDVLTISGPSAGGDPVCTIKVSDDRRYMIYPPEYGD